MRNTLRTTLATALLAGLAFSTQAQDAPAATDPTPVMQVPAVALPAGLSAPEAGKGQVVFFRPSKMMGAAIGYKVREGETELGKLRNGTYFVIQVEPGKHEYTVHSEAKDVLTLEVDAGETYFVQGGMSMGVLAGRPNLSPSNADAFAAVAPKLKVAKPLD